MKCVAAACCTAFLCGHAAAAEAEAAAQRIDQDPSAVTVHSRGRTVLVYCPLASPMKPYVAKLFTPGGVQVLRDSPRDHQHHHALMFAVAVNGVDFWAEGKQCGRQVPRGVEGVQSSAVNGVSRARFVQRLDWVGPNDAKLLREERTIESLTGPEIHATLLTWQSRLQAPAGSGPVKLTGSHYFGLGMRFVESMDQAGEFFNSEGTTGPIVRGSERLTPAKWCAYMSHVDDRPVTVAIFAHPKNLRPAHFFTMRPFAYLGATLNFWKEPMELNAGQVLDLRYGVALWDGEIERGQVESLYQKWIELQP